jgi:hypothetical protein
MDFFFIFLIGRDGVHLALRPLFGLLHQPQLVILIVQQSVEFELEGETEVLAEKCPSATLSTTNPT